MRKKATRDIHTNYTSILNTPIPITYNLNCGRLALAICLGGVVLAVLIGLAARLFGYDACMWAYLVFASFQIAAIVIGYRARRDPLGRASAITASILFVLSFGLL